MPKRRDDDMASDPELQREECDGRLVAVDDASRCTAGVQFTEDACAHEGRILHGYDEPTLRYAPPNNAGALRIWSEDHESPAKQDGEFGEGRSDAVRGGKVSFRFFSG